MKQQEIPYLSLKAINAPYESAISSAMQQVLSSGWYLQGKAVRRFEQNYASYIGTRHCIACGNGLDALKLMLQAEIVLGRMREGDEVLVAANTYIATILAITSVGLTPVLVEPSLDTLQIDDHLIEQHITEKTRALLTVHLYGKCSVTPHMLRICQRHHLLLLEDNAQAHGCKFQPGLSDVPAGWQGKRTGSLGSAAAHSFYPGKNLGALGDAGAVTTDDDALAEVVRALGNYGSARKYVFDYQGRNSRMDELQAAALCVKLLHLDETNHVRQSLAQYYLECLGVKVSEDEVSTLFAGTDSSLFVPRKMYENTKENVVHIFPILSTRREDLQQYLLEHGVHTMIHYPIPPHQQRCYEKWNTLSLPVTERIHREELSLPCNQCMSRTDIERIAELILRFG